MKTNQNSIEEDTPDRTLQELRRSILSEELIACKPKRTIIEEYSKEWNLPPQTIRAMITETLIWLAQSTKTSREEIRALNGERLDDLFGSAEGLKDKLRIIDMLNRIYGVYEQNVNLNQSDTEIKFSFGGDKV